MELVAGTDAACQHVGIVVGVCRERHEHSIELRHGTKKIYLKIYLCYSVGVTEELYAPLPTTAGGFKTILADPPWRFQNRTGKVAPEHKRLGRYGTMSLDEIKALPVDDITAKDAHLYLWVQCLAARRHRGHAGMGVPLRVEHRLGQASQGWRARGRGVGFYFRNVTELLLFGVKGHMRTLDAGRRQVNMIETRKREHSRKPDEQYDLITSCSPGPYLEMFARYPQPHWSAWGNEADESVTPQGKVYKGYTGGEIENMPPLENHERLTRESELAVGKLLRDEYESGRSIKDLAAEHDYSIARVRRYLSLVDTQLRPQGRTPALQHS